VKPDAQIVLVGLMGAGKSGVARSLAERLGGTVLDTDQQIEATAGASVASIFANEGESSFRERELDELRAALASSGTVVIATGGGIVMTDAARAVLCEHHPVVFLDVSVDVAAARVGDGRGRPLLEGDVHARLSTLWSERRALYEEVADVAVDADVQSVTKVVDAIVAAIGGVS
jgi:shikimate kinase